MSSLAIISFDGSPTKAFKNANVIGGILHVRTLNGTYLARVGDGLVVSGSEIIATVGKAHVACLQEAIAHPVVYDDKPSAQPSDDELGTLLDAFNVPHGYDHIDLGENGYLDHLHVSTYHRFLWILLRLQKSTIKNAWIDVSNQIILNAESNFYEFVGSDGKATGDLSLEQAKDLLKKDKKGHINRASVSKGSTAYVTVKA